MSANVTKLGPQAVQIGNDTVFASDGRDHYRYSEGDLVTRVRCDHLYKKPIPKRLLSSLFLGDHLAKSLVLRVFVSETTSWVAPVAGMPMSADQRLRFRTNVELALRCLGTNSQIV